MRLAFVFALSLATPSLVTGRPISALPPYQAGLITSGGLETPSDDAMAIATIFVERLSVRFPITDQAVADRFVGDWTKYNWAKPPCDVKQTKCLASAQTAARSLAPLWSSKVREGSLVLHAALMTRRYNAEELSVVRAFISSSAGQKTPTEAFMGSDQSAQYQRLEKQFADGLNALEQDYKSKFFETTRSLPRAAPPLPPQVVTPGGNPK